MRQKVDIEMERFKLLKAVRTGIRLKHSLAADQEINEVLPRIEADFDAAIGEGRAFEIDIRSAVYDG